MLDCMVGFDPKDGFTGINLINGPPSYATNLDPSKIKSARIGIVRELFGSDSDPYCKAVNTVSNDAIAKLAASGTAFVDVQVPNLKHYMTFTPTYLQRSRSDINAFLATKPHLPQDIADIIPKKSEKMFLDFTSMMAHGPRNPNDDPCYVQKILDRDAFHRTLLSLMSSQKLDALCFPDCQIPAPSHDDATNGRFPTCWDFPVNTLLASQSRLPAITVLAGFTEDGLPVGLEFVSWDSREKALLEFAKGMEEIVGARRAPPSPL
jgi:amidase